MNVLTVRSEYRTPTDKAPSHGECCFQDRQAKRNHRDGHGNDRRRLLRPLERQCAQHETNEKATAISEKNSCRIEVKSQEAQNGTGQRQRQQRHQGGLAEQRYYEYHEGGEKCGARCQTIQSIDQVECIGDSQYPKDGERQTNESGKMVITE